MADDQSRDLNNEFCNLPVVRTRTFKSTVPTGALAVLLDAALLLLLLPASGLPDLFFM